MVTALNDCYSGRDELIKTLRENIESVVFDDTNLKKIDEELLELQTELMSADEEAERMLADRIESLRKEKDETLSDAAERSDLENRMNDMIEFLNIQQTVITEYSDVITRRFVERITIFDEKIVVELKSGIQVEVEL